MIVYWDTQPSSPEDTNEIGEISKPTRVKIGKVDTKTTIKNKTPIGDFGRNKSDGVSDLSNGSHFISASRQEFGKIWEDQSKTSLNVDKIRLKMASITTLLL